MFFFLFKHVSFFSIKIIKLSEKLEYVLVNAQGLVAGSKKLDTAIKSRLLGWMGYCDQTRHALDTGSRYYGVGLDDTIQVNCVILQIRILFIMVNIE